MKICVAQTRPVKGKPEENILQHTRLIDKALAEGVEVIVFPELSITGYEPSLARELATDQHDSRFMVFQQISNARQLTIGVGMPVKSGSKPQIGMLIFQPQQPVVVYAKQHLHADELPYFEQGHQQVYVEHHEVKIALAICYEISVPAHADNAYHQGASVYVASVAKTTEGIEKAGQILSAIAKKYHMPVLLSNCTGPCDDFKSAGKSAVWNSKGERLGQLDDRQEGILVYDTVTQQTRSLVLNDE